MGRNIKTFPEWTEPQLAILYKYSHLSSLTIKRRLKDAGHNRAVADIERRLDATRPSRRNKDGLPIFPPPGRIERECLGVGCGKKIIVPVGTDGLAAAHFCNECSDRNNGHYDILSRCGIVETKRISRKRELR